MNHTIPSCPSDVQREALYGSHRLTPFSSHSLSSDRRMSHNPAAVSQDYYHTHDSIAEQREHSDGTRNDRDDPWTFPSGMTARGLDALWSRPVRNGMLNAADSPATNTGRQSNMSGGFSTMTNGNNGTSDSLSIGSVGTRVAPNIRSLANHNQRTLGNTATSDLSNNTTYPHKSGLFGSITSDYTSETGNSVVGTLPTGTTSTIQHDSTLPPGNTEPHYGNSREGSQTSQKQGPQLNSTLYWGDLEPWMDEQYAKEVCELMGWNQVNIKIPHAPTDPVTGHQPNNPGFCFLTFPTPQYAATAMQQINNAPNGGQPILPNSSKPFILNWANASNTLPVAQEMSSSYVPNGTNNAQKEKEYSIFVGDLAPETSNSDLVAVFRNPILGLRNDRVPKYIQPFNSCKSAKIMLDPVTGISRGYGFVRFSDEADQQRALLEMHGLYCLSRPMRISAATAKVKNEARGSISQPHTAIDGTFPMDQVTPQNLNSNVSVATSRSGSSIGSSVSIPSLTSSSTASSVSAAFLNGQAPPATLDTFFQLLANAPTTDTKNTMNRVLPSITAPMVLDQQKLDESWKHQAQARAILGNLIGPNGEQLTSTDPYNTTVFVGGLSPLISEETLRTFFAPFGEIHYVKVPTGKHCGFVQFVRKADAERSIQKLQGYSIGGSKIRLSWGRSQYKAAQAAAQAAVQAQAQAQATQGSSLGDSGQISYEQAIEFLQKAGYNGFGSASTTNRASEISQGYWGSQGMNNEIMNSALLNSSSVNGRFAEGNNQYNMHQAISGFSPFSPDPNYLANLVGNRELGISAEGMSTIQSSISKRGSEVLPSGSERLSTAAAVGLGGVGRSATPSQVQQPQESHDFGSARAGGRYSMDRAPLRSFMEASLIRPSSLQTAATSHKESQAEHDPLADLNGTLASLDLDASVGSGSARSPGQSTDSGKSVQFRMNMNSPTSPA